MLRENNCYTRKCKWYKGVKQPSNDEMNEFHYCAAFPDGIPREINIGDNIHTKILPEQVGEYFYKGVK